jgi:hypothetical protein
MSINLISIPFSGVKCLKRTHTNFKLLWTEVSIMRNKHLALIKASHIYYITQRPKHSLSLIQILLSKMEIFTHSFFITAEVKPINRNESRCLKAWNTNFVCSKMPTFIHFVVRNDARFCNETLLDTANLFHLCMLHTI